MHLNDKRVTVIFGNVYWFTFSIKDNCAYSILSYHIHKNEEKTGTDFVRVGDRIHICTNFHFKDIKNENIINESYNLLTCNLIDLDGTEAQSSETNEQIK